MAAANAVWPLAVVTLATCSVCSLCMSLVSGMGWSKNVNVWTQAHDDRGVVNMSVYNSADRLVTAGAGLIYVLSFYPRDAVLVRVLAMVLCPFVGVCLSVCHKSVFYQKG